MRATVRLLVLGLGANLVAGTRLALFLPVSRFDFRISAGNFAALVAANLVFWFAGGILREGLPGEFSTQALTIALAQIPLLLMACALAARIFARPSLLAAFAVVLSSSDLAFEIVGTAIGWAFGDRRFPGFAGVVNWVFIGWSVLVLARVQWLLTGWRPWRSAAAGSVFALMLALFIWVFPRSEVWQRLQPARDDWSRPSVAREDLFHLQGALLDRQLSRLRPERPGVEDIYFLGVAPYALQDTFVRELQVVTAIVENRFDAAGRSLALVNHPGTLAEIPVATVSNLRTAIGRFARTINADEDVLFLFLSTHGSESGELAFELPPLNLRQLTPTALSRMLNDAGIKWKVIVISACYSGGFVEPLRDDHTLIITSSDATHQSFGCEATSDFTWFGRAFFDQALRQTNSLPEAFERAKQNVAERERAMGYEPSNPQISIGAAMRGKLASIRSRLEAAARRAARGPSM